MSLQGTLGGGDGRIACQLSGKELKKLRQAKVLQQAVCEALEGRQYFSVPTAPSSLVATVNGPTSIALAWADNSSNETGFKIQESINGGAGWPQAAAPAANATSYTVTSLNAGTAYEFRVVAYDSDGNSTPSNVVNATTTPAPTAPSGLSATTASPSQINLAWTNNDTSGTVTAIYVQENVNGSYLRLATLAATATSYNAGSLSAGTSYSFRIVAYNGANSTPSNVASATTVAAPTAPSALSATTASPSQINLAWTNNDTSGTVTSILVQENVNGNYLLLATLSATAASYSAHSLTAGTSYSFRIVAYNGADSTPSNVATAATFAAPVAPSSLSATTLSPSQISLAWTNNDTSGSVSSMLVQENVAGNYLLLATLSATATSYTAHSLTAGTSYSFRIVAYNGANSTPSNVASATTGAAPTAPSSLSATVASSTQVNLAWTNNDTSGTVTAVIVQELVNGNYLQLATLSATAVSYSAIELSPGTSYSFRVVAYNGADSTPSNVATASIPAVPIAPRNLTAAAVSSTQINLSWTNNAHNDNDIYAVWQSNGNDTSYNQIATISASSTSFTVSNNLSAGTTYYFKLIALDASRAHTDTSNETHAQTYPLPLAPSAVTATAVSATQINLTWTNNDTSGTVTVISLEQSTNGGSFSQIASISPSDTSYVIANNLSPGTSYAFRMQTHNGASSAYSNTATASTFAVPVAPSGLSADVISSTQVNLAWTNNDTSGTVAVISLEESVNGGSYNQIASIPPSDTTFSVFNLSAATNYSFRVQGHNGANSAYSNVATATTFTLSDAPTNLAAGVASSSQINLSWTNHNVSGTVTSVIVEQRPDGSGSYSQVASLSASASSYSVGGLDASTSYDFRILAVDSDGDTASSNAVSATTDVDPAPAAPSDLAATAVSATEIDLAWTNNDDGDPAVVYALEESADGGEYNQIASVSPSDASYDVANNLNPGTSYTFQLIALDADGNSATSNAAGATTFAAPLAPSGLSATAASATEIDLSWTNNDTSGTVTVISLEESVNGGSYNQIASIAPSDTSYNVSNNLTAGTSYAFRVQTHNGASSDYSNTASAMTFAVPVAPSGVTAAGATPTQINLSWSNNDTSGTVTVISVEQSVNGGAFSQIASVSPTATSLGVFGLDTSDSYSFRVQAHNGADSDYSNVAIGTTVLASPTQVQSQVISGTEIRVIWNSSPSGSVTGYMIEQSSDGGATWTTLTTTSSSTTAYNATGLSLGTSYQFGVTTMGSGSGATQSLRAATSSMSTESTDESGLWAVSIRNSTLQPGSKLFDASGSIALVGSATGVVDVSASSWQDAVMKVISGKAYVNNTSIGQTVTYSFSCSGAFEVVDAADDPGIPSGAGQVIVLEDQFNEPGNDSDYNDDYFQVQAVPVTPYGSSAIVGQNVSTGAITLGSFHQTSASAGDFSAVINWGDGATSDGDIHALGDGNYSVTGSHTYPIDGVEVATTEVKDGGAGGSGTGAGFFLATYLEVRPNQNLGRLESPDSPSISFAATSFALTESVDPHAGTFSVSGGSTVAYSLSQTDDIANEDDASGIGRTESGGTATFALSSSGTYSPDGVTYSVQNYSLNSTGSATLTLADDRRVINDSYDQARSSTYTYTNAKTLSHGATYTWTHTEAASSLAVTGSGQLYEDQFQLNQNDGLVNEEAGLLAWFKSNAGLYGSYSVTGNQNYSENLSETGTYSSEASTLDRTETTSEQNSLVETGSNGSLAFSQTLNSSEGLPDTESITLHMLGTSYSLSDNAVAGYDISARSVSDQSSTTTGGGTVEASVSFTKKGHLSGDFTLTTVAGDYDSDLTLSTVNQGQAILSSPSESYDYSDTNQGNATSGDFTLGGGGSGSDITNQTTTDRGLTEIDTGSVPFSRNISQNGNLQEDEILSVTYSSSGGTLDASVTNNPISSEVYSFPSADYTLSATIAQDSGDFGFSVTHSYSNDSDSTSDNQSLHVTGGSNSNSDDTITGSGNAISGDYSGVTDKWENTVTANSTSTNGPLTVTDDNTTTQSGTHDSSGNDFNGTVNSNSTYNDTASDTWTSTNQAQTVFSTTTSGYQGNTTASSSDWAGNYGSTATYSSEVTNDSTTTNQNIHTTDHNTSEDDDHVDINTGNSWLGTYSSFDDYSMTGSDAWTSTNGPEHDSGGSGGTYTGTTTEDGNNISGGYSNTIVYGDSVGASTTFINGPSTLIDNNSATHDNTVTSSGNDITGDYSTSSTYLDTGTDNWTSTNSPESDNGGTTGTYTGTATGTGNYNTGTYTSDTTYGDTITNNTTTSNQSLHTTDSNTATHFNIEHDNGNTTLGDYTTSTSYLDSSTDGWTSTNGPEHDSGGSGGAYTGTATATGNNFTKNYSSDTSYGDSVGASTTFVNGPSTLIDHNTATHDNSVHNGGNSNLGDYSTSSTYLDTSTDNWTSTNSPESDNGGTTGTYTGTATGTGNYNTGTYTSDTTYGDTITNNTTTSNQSLHTTDSNTATHFNIEHDNGNTTLGDYTTSTSYLDSSTDGWTSTNGPEHDSGGSGGIYTGTATGSGNYYTGTYTADTSYGDSLGASTTSINQSSTLIDHNTATHDNSVHNTGNSKSKAYSTTSSYLDTSTDTWNSTNQDEHDNGGTTATYTGTATGSGNNNVGDYTSTTTYGDTLSANTTTSNQSQETTDYNTATHDNTVTNTGNNVTGGYSTTSTYLDTSTDTWNSTNQDEDDNGGTTATYTGTAGGSGNYTLGNYVSNTTYGDTISANTTTSNESLATTDHNTENDNNVENDSGNTVSYAYTTTNTYNDSNTDSYSSDDGEQFVTSNSTGTNNGTTTNTGNSNAGNYNTTGNYFAGTTATTTTTDQDQLVTDTATNTGTSTLTGSGNNVSKTYGTTTTYTNTAGDNSTTTNLSLNITDSSSSTDIGTTTNTGNSATGAYTLSTNDSTTGGGSDSGTAGTRTFLDTYSSGSSTTSTDTGNSDDETDTYISGQASGSTLTTTDTYSGGGFDTQTLTSSGASAITNFTDSGNGTYVDFAEGSSSQNTYETGFQANSYTLSGTSSSATTSDKSGDDDTNLYTLDTGSTDTSSNTRTGTDGSGNTFSIVQADSNSGTVHTTGNSSVGDYTATATGTDTLTTDENISGIGNSSTLHQVVSGGSTLTNTANDFSGSFNTTNVEQNTTTLIQSGYNTSGSYSLNESMTDNPTIILSGNDINGTQNYSQSGEQVYSLHQTNTSGSDHYTLDGTGDKPYTITGTDNANTGVSNRTETGTDAYTLTQTGVSSGSSFSIGLTGSDGYETDSTINSQTGAFSTTTTGTGTYTKTGTGAGSGSTDFSSTEVGSTRDSDLVLTTSGTSRYDLLLGFNNTSDGGNGTAGMGDYSPVGLPVMVGRASVPAGIFSSLGDARYEYCFAAGTKIVLADHPPRNIEEMEEGLRVPAAPDTDPESTPTPCHILKVFRNAPAPIWHVNVVGGDLIRTTANHPFHVQGKGWIAASKLQPGDQLRTFDGGWIEVESVYDSGVVEPVFNLQVEAAHTYFVQLPGGPAVLVHNVSDEDLNPCNPAASLAHRNTTATVTPPPPAPANINYGAAAWKSLTDYLNGNCYHPDPNVTDEQVDDALTSDSNYQTDFGAWFNNAKNEVKSTVADGKTAVGQGDPRGNGLDIAAAWARLVVKAVGIATLFAGGAEPSPEVPPEIPVEDPVTPTPEVTTPEPTDVSSGGGAANSSPTPTGTTPPSLLQRYLSESGGRWGNTATRQLNNRLATDLESRGFRVNGGAGRAGEEWFSGPGGGTKGGTFVDLTATNGSQTIRIQTVTTLADGVTPTVSEAAAAARIRARFPNNQLILVSKQTGQVIP